jgi:hypothetical protein
MIKIKKKNSPSFSLLFDLLTSFFFLHVQLEIAAHEFEEKDFVI